MLDVLPSDVQNTLLNIARRQPRVIVDIARPGTFEAFEDHLRSRPPGWYDLVHFDLHGKVE